MKKTAEFIKTNKIVINLKRGVFMKKIERIAAYIEEIARGKHTMELYREYEEDILSVEADELFTLFYNRLNQGETPDQILTYLDRLMHVFAQSLKTKEMVVNPDSFIDHMIKENCEMANRMDQIKKLLALSDYTEKKDDLIERFEELHDFNVHYVKKENILFPYLEKADEKYTGVSIMWTLHDQMRKTLKNILQRLKEVEFDQKAFIMDVGRYFFQVYGLIQKEEVILYPVALKTLTSQQHDQMRKQSFEIGFAFIETPAESIKEDSSQEYVDWIYRSETGELTYEQLTLFINALPVDCTLIDENNKVRYFTRPKDRIFPRSPAIIGRDVRNCHPADSVDVVNKIIEAFRNNERDVATFWIDMRGKKLLIQYYALRNTQGEYKGTLEVSQDITDIQKLEGQRRLLQWE
jgi:hypothetical protein